ncbi:hypothetical protein V1505DRAFT_67560 [Lipomyces doorenjongii]
MKVEYLYRALVKRRVKRAFVMVLFLLAITASVTAAWTWKVRFALSGAIAVTWVILCASGVGRAACVIAVITTMRSAVELEVSSSDNNSGMPSGFTTKRSINSNMTHVVGNVTYPYFNPRAVTPGIVSRLTIDGLTFQYSRTQRNTSKIQYVFPTSGLERRTNELVGIVAEYDTLAENGATFSSGAKNSIASDLLGYVNSQTMQVCTTLEDASHGVNMQIGWTFDSQDYSYENDLPPCASSGAFHFLLA